MTANTPEIKLFRRDANTNGGRNGDIFTVECNGYPLEIGLGDACVMLEAIDKGPKTAKKAYVAMLARRTSWRPVCFA